MKVSVTLRIEVDPEAWAAIYGTYEAAIDIRNDVKSYAHHQLADSAAAIEGAIKTVEVGR